MDFISDFGKNLILQKSVEDISSNAEYQEFHFIGYKETKTAINLIALVGADNLTHTDIIRLRDIFFTITVSLPREFNLNPRGRNPNGLLIFVFKQKCSQIKFIQKQTKISHAVQGGVIVSWIIDFETRSLYTHNNPVSLFPPVVLLSDYVFPGVKFIEDFLNSYSSMDAYSNQIQAEKISSKNSNLKLKELEEHWNVLSEKISRLRQALVLETDITTKFKYEKQLEAIEKEREQIVSEIQRIENQ
ncbi:MAG: hypothetical protein GY795_44815 [Desulfobacterales bacterium]|nr:hypothetical protein [Desulfobacterales bacterium]